MVWGQEPEQGVGPGWGPSPAGGLARRARVAIPPGVVEVRCRGCGRHTHTLTHTHTHIHMHIHTEREMRPDAHTCTQTCERTHRVRETPDLQHIDSIRPACTHGFAREYPHLCVKLDFLPAKLSRV